MGRKKGIPQIGSGSGGRAALWRKVACPVCRRGIGQSCTMGASCAYVFHQERLALAKQQNAWGVKRTPSPTGAPLDWDAAVEQALAAFRASGEVWPREEGK